MLNIKRVVLFWKINNIIMVSISATMKNFSKVLIRKKQHAQKVFIKILVIYCIKVSTYINKKSLIL